VGAGLSLLLALTLAPGMSPVMAQEAASPLQH